MSTYNIREKPYTNSINRVNNVAIDEMSGVVSLSSSRLEWREAFPSIDVYFARRDSSKIQRRGTTTKRQSQQGTGTTKEPKATVTREYPTTPSDTQISQAMLLMGLENHLSAKL